MIGAVIPHPTSDPLAHISYFASVIIAMTPIVGGLWAGYRHHEKKKAAKFDQHVAKVEALHDAIVGKEPTIDAPHPDLGVLQRLKSVEVAVEEVRREVTPNGGNTNRLGDRVKRLEERLAKP